MNLVSKDIYKNFEPLPLDNQGWNGNSPLFEELIEKVKPTSIIEVGTWKGQSAISMATALKNREMKADLYCVDTWLGAVEFWTSHKNTPERNLLLKNGYPQIYYQFLSNVIHSGLTDYILPLPLPSNIAAKTLKNFGVKAQLIYIDASHEYEDVLSDINLYSELLDEGGVIFGDDFNQGGFPGVKKAVKESFGDDFDLLYDNFWVHKKKSSKFKFTISSNVNYAPKTYKKIVSSLLSSGVPASDIYFFIGGADKYEKIQNEEGVNLYTAPHNSFDFTGLISVLDLNIHSDYWFLLHDTCKVDENFYLKIKSFDHKNADTVRLCEGASGNIGSYKWSYLQNMKNVFLKLKNWSAKEWVNYMGHIQKFGQSVNSIPAKEYKKFAVFTEDMFFKPSGLFYQNVNNQLFYFLEDKDKPERLIKYGQTAYNGVARIAEYYSQIGLWKYKSNFEFKQEYSIEV